MLPDHERLPEIEAPRVRLRWLEPSDTDDLFTIFSDPVAMRYWSRPPLTHRDEAAQLVTEIQRLFADRRLFQWGVERRDDRRIIGTVTLASLDASNRRCEVGFILASDVWRQGYMREALRVALDFAFDELGMMRVEADVDPHNAASLGILERLGFVREGLLRERWRVGGEVQDSVMLGLLRRQWRDDV